MSVCVLKKQECCERLLFPTRQQRTERSYGDNPEKEGHTYLGTTLESPKLGSHAVFSFGVL